jgi:HTH-type transcriptional regulator/antitoxin HigA
MKTNLQPARVVSPGAILTQELEARDWTQRDLANIMGRPYQAINEIVSGSKQITPDTARELARAFDTSVDFWMNLESNYRLHLAEQDKKENEISRRSRLYNVAPIREMLKRSWLKESKNIGDLESQLCSFFGVSSLDALSASGVNFRHAPDREFEKNAQRAWVRQVENIAKAQTVKSFSVERLKREIPSILDSSGDANAIAEVPENLLKLGVHFAILPHLPKTYIDGAAIVTKKNPIVALTLRYDRIDSFWFTLTHELAHIVLGHKGILLDDVERGSGSGNNQEEQEANELASTWLVDQKALVEFIAERKPYFSKSAIEDFALKINRHPAIVLGQLQHKKATDYKTLRGLLTTVSPYLDHWVYN